LSRGSWPATGRKEAQAGQKGLESGSHTNRSTVERAVAGALKRERQGHGTRALQEHCREHGRSAHVLLVLEDTRELLVGGLLCPKHKPLLQFPDLKEALLLQLSVQAGTDLHPKKERGKEKCQKKRRRKKDSQKEGESESSRPFPQTCSQPPSGYLKEASPPKQAAPTIYLSRQPRAGLRLCGWGALMCTKELLFVPVVSVRTPYSENTFFLHLFPARTCCENMLSEHVHS